MRAFILSLFVSINISCSSTKEICGYYASNVASLGFFVEKVQLNTDSTFKFEFSGDLQYHKGRGTYTFRDNIVYLNFEPFIIDQSDPLAVIQAIDTVNRPKKYLYKNHKLWSYHVEGHIVKRGQGISRHKKYLVFGDRYMTKRKMYLKKFEGKEILWRGGEASR